MLAARTPRGGESVSGRPPSLGGQVSDAVAAIIGTGVAVVLSLIGGAWRLSSRISTIEVTERLHHEETAARLKRIESKLG